MQQSQEHTKQRKRYTAGHVFADGRILEMVYDPIERRTAFAMYYKGAVRIAQNYEAGGELLLPYAPENPLVESGVIMLPSEPVDYESEEVLIKEIQEFIYRYLDITDEFLKIASYWVLFTYLFDRFDVCVFLRAVGSPGCGKSRFIHTIGSLAYRGCLASGAASVASLFRICHTWSATIIVDEADLKSGSDESHLMTKFFNLGNWKYGHILRAEFNEKTKKYEATPYNVYSPKICAMRKEFPDTATEMRFLSYYPPAGKLRKDIPINLPMEQFQREALQLRNKLLLFRFRNYHQAEVNDTLIDRSLEPRINQITVPLLSVISDETVRADIQRLVRKFNEELKSDRGMFDVEARVLEIIKELQDGQSIGRVTIADITIQFSRQHGSTYGEVTPHWIGHIVRKRLALRTHKSGGRYGIPVSEQPKLNGLYDKYGIDEGGEAAPETTKSDRAERPEQTTQAD